ncbi:hypothetical protein HETIRDRAFT_419558 [Heterobasidion irregulare TC 32-1]|uniref:Uncharacterized protein n=1 Tax=Heterobasidion irregulare (strain TC 32-1) TaxID=747525 RepID=W4K272_HETIT|nr:uncharacterized protein HETIRDRAFT_419558 [Heterobasidion irregulare TC 32-1]ETW79918.1 hypothetical protein HETIRDRAFT_419558 [Heterobasidion irregulare TC 32-1]
MQASGALPMATMVMIGMPCNPHPANHGFPLERWPSFNPQQMQQNFKDAFGNLGID